MSPSENMLKAVLSAGLVASVGVAVWIWRASGYEIDKLCWLIWPAMLVHQCEENIFTEWVLGPRYAFLRWVRTVGYDLTVGKALALNVGVGWTLAIFSGLCGHHNPMPLFVIGVESVNAFWHLSVTSLQRRWSPGTASSVLLTIPLAFWLFYAFIDEGIVDWSTCLGLFLFAAVSHHLFLGSLPRVDQRSAAEANRDADESVQR